MRVADFANVCFHDSDGRVHQTPQRSEDESPRVIGGQSEELAEDGRSYSFTGPHVRTQQTDNDRGLSPVCIGEPSPKEIAKYASQVVAGRQIAGIETHFGCIQLLINPLLYSHVRKEVCNHKRDVWHNLVHAEKVEESTQTNNHQVLHREHCRVLISNIHCCHASK